MNYSPSTANFELTTRFQGIVSAAPQA